MRGLLKADRLPVTGGPRQQHHGDQMDRLRGCQPVDVLTRLLEQVHQEVETEETTVIRIETNTDVCVISISRTQRSDEQRE